MEELARAPVGRYVTGETFVHFCAAPALWGLILWGRPEDRHAQQIGRSLILELAPPAEPHASIVDASRLDGGDPAAFRSTERYLSRHADVLKAWVTKLALIRPSGMGGAIVAGAYEVLPRPYPVAVFHDPATAFAWLDAGVADGPALLAELHAAATGPAQIVGALRAFLRTRLDGDVDLAAAAHALGTSDRTLQRKLGEAGTTFSDELTHARIDAAKQKLVDTDTPLTSIAFDVGCASLQHFSALFRKQTGETPSAYRARHRAR